MSQLSQPCGVASPLDQLPRLVDTLHFPASCRHVASAARALGMSPDIMRLLRRFPRDTIFTTDADLLVRCEELELLLGEEQESPREFLKSP